jgi:hypothetical protein
MPFSGRRNARQIGSLFGSGRFFQAENPTISMAFFPRLKDGLV